MLFNEYQHEALKTASKQSKKDLLLNGVMGLNGESGECIDIVKKHLFQGHELNIDKLVEELGDVLWYVAITAESLGMQLGDIANYNIQKLRNRYPGGFSSKNSINRENTFNAIQIGEKASCSNCGAAFDGAVIPNLCPKCMAKRELHILGVKL